MNVVYATDENYSYLTGISIVSLFENNRDEKIEVYVIGDGISEENQRHLQAIAQKYEQKISIIQQPDLEQMAGVKIQTTNWSLSAFARLFLPELLPQDIDRVIWLDCDTIVVDSLGDLWKTELGGGTGAVRDCTSYFKRKQGFGREDWYFNTGVLLIDLEVWRNQGIEQQLIQTLVDSGGVSVDVDQGIINRTLKGKIATLPERYNVISHDFIWGIRKMNFRNEWDSEKEFYSLAERKEALKNPAVLHFVGGDMGCLRPWYEGCIHPRKEDFIKYKNLSPWKEMPLLIKHTDAKTRILFWTSIWFPRLHRFYVKVRSRSKE